MDAAEREYVAVLRGLTPQAKLAVAQRLRETAWAVAAAGLRARHPDLPDEAIEARVRGLFLRATS